MNANNNSPWGNEPQPPKKTARSFVIVAVAVLVVILIFTVILSSSLSEGQGAGLLYDFLLLAIVGAGLIGHVVSNPGQALRNIAGWVLIFGILGLGYSIWNGSSRLGSEFNPGRGNIENGAISFRADLRGHYMATAKINGQDIKFLIDTGATDIALSMKDAIKIGFKESDLSFNMQVSTANGTAYVAPVIIDKIELGPIVFNNLRGSVSPAGMDISLLGMSFLNQLSAYEVKDGLLTLYP